MKASSGMARAAALESVMEGGVTGMGGQRRMGGVAWTLTIARRVAAWQQRGDRSAASWRAKAAQRGEQRRMAEPDVTCAPGVFDYNYEGVAKCICAWRDCLLQKPVRVADFCACG